jgi:hypothetical protein
MAKPWDGPFPGYGAGRNLATRYQLVLRCVGSRIAVFTARWGVLASLTSLRTAIAIAGVLILTTSLLLPRPRRRRSRSLSEPAVISNPLA